MRTEEELKKQLAHYKVMIDFGYKVYAERSEKSVEMAIKEYEASYEALHWVLGCKLKRSMKDLTEEEWKELEELEKKAPFPSAHSYCVRLREILNRSKEEEQEK